MSCLLTTRVRGCNRVPDPPANTIPFLAFNLLNALILIVVF
jgi:hypothetical protein